MKRLYLIALCVMLATGASAQQKQSKRKRNAAAYNKQNKENEKFLEKQFWLGLKAGGNLSKPRVETAYSVLSPTNYDASVTRKQYDSFRQMGSQATLELNFYYRGFSFSLQPTYQHSVFAYSNSYEWISLAGRPNDNVVLNYEQEQKVNHAVIPVTVKYEFVGHKIRPYLQAGFYSAILIDASKSVTVSGTDMASGGTNTFRNEPIMVGAKDLFAKNHWGLLGGAGFYYSLQNNVRLNLDIMYKYGMSNISSTKNRYGSDRLSGVNDAMDDLTLDNLSFSLGCLFPLRFLESGFKSLDRKK